MVNKKGQLGAYEIFFALTMLFGIAIFIVVLSHSWGEISPNLEDALNSANPGSGTTFNFTTMNSKVTGGVTLFNLMYPFILLGLIVFCLISAFLAKDHPAFLFVSLIILAVAILLGAVFSNTYQALITGTGLESSADAFGITKLFMKNLPIIIGIVAVVTIFGLFALGRSKGGTGGL